MPPRNQNIELKHRNIIGLESAPILFLDQFVILRASPKSASRRSKNDARYV